MIRIRKNIFFVSLIISFLLNLDKIVLGPSSLIRVNDTFDSNFPHIFIHVSNLLKYGFVSQFPQTICGVTNYVLNPILNFNILTQLAFPPFINYLFNSVFTIFIAFLGMYLFLEDEVKLGRSASFIGALFFSSITVWLPGGITVVGVPLLIWVLERIFDENYSFINKVAFYGYVLIFLFSCNFVIFGFVLVPFYLAYFMFISKIKKKLSNIILIIMIGALYFLINLPAAVEVFVNASAGHRNSFVYSNPSLFSAFKYFLLNIFSLNTHCFYLSAPTLLGLFIISYFVLSNWGKPKRGIFYFSAFLIASIEFFSFFIYKTPLYGALRENFGFLSGIQFDRIYYLLIILFSVLIAIGCDFIIKNKECLNKKNWIISVSFVSIYFLISFILNYLIFDSQIGNTFVHYLIQCVIQPVPILLFLIISRTNGSKNIVIALIVSFSLFSILNTMHSRIYFGVNSFRSYFDSDQIDEIKELEGENINKFRVVRMGVNDPAQLLFNGFKCADGYVVLYPQTYKEFWAKVIEPEITKSFSFRDYFLGWGNKVCLFDSLNKDGVIDDLTFNPHLLKLINVKYLFSDKIIVGYEKYDFLQVAQPSEEYKRLAKWKKKILYKKEYYIYKNKEFAPQVFLTDLLDILGDDETLLEKMADKEYYYLKTHTFTTLNESEDLVDIDKVNLSHSKIINYELTPDKIVINLRNKYPVILNLTINYHPNWFCRIDGKEVDVFRIYNAFMGVVVPANSHKIEFIYINPYLGYAYGIFVFGFLGSNVFVLLSLWRERRRRTLPR